MDFNVGDKVEFTHPKKGKISGSIIQVKRKKLIVKDNAGKEWDIPKEYLEVGSKVESLKETLSEAKVVVEGALETLKKKPGRPPKVQKETKSQEFSLPKEEIEAHSLSGSFDYRKCIWCKHLDLEKQKDDDKAYCKDCKSYVKKSAVCGSWRFKF